MATFAEQQVERLQTLLAANVGVQAVTVGGRTVAYVDLTEQLEYWQSKVARENGTRPRNAQIILRDS
jgi:hypothetical protein